MLSSVVATMKQELFDYFVTQVTRDQEVKSLREKIAALHDQYQAKLVEVRTIGTPRLPRTTHIFHRGDFLSPKDEVQPDVPAILSAFRPRGPSADRLDLARWLVSRENFLTPRVAQPVRCSLHRGARCARLVLPGDVGWPGARGAGAAA